MKKAIVIGAGISGSTIARQLADLGYHVDIYEHRLTIAGNLYDYKKNGIIIQKYGPHIFHTNDKEVFDFLSKFTNFVPYYHQVNAKINNKEIPIPFNFKSIDTIFPNKCEKIKKELINQYGEGNSIPILTLQNNSNKLINKVSKYVYQYIFEKYTCKQWGVTPYEIDKSVTSRVPVRLSYENNYFLDKYQAMPEEGFASMVEEMLNHPRIDIHLGVTYNFIKIKNNKIYIDGKEENCPVFYTGTIDRLFNYMYGELPYRSLKFILEEKNKESYQSKAVVNYTYNKKYTRITEFSKFTSKPSNVTYIIKEYSLKGNKRRIPYYPIPQKENKEHYDIYLKLAKNVDNLFLAGRLATYSYMNIDKVVRQAIDVVNEYIGDKENEKNN